MVAVLFRFLIERSLEYFDFSSRGHIERLVGPPEASGKAKQEEIESKTTARGTVDLADARVLILQQSAEALHKADSVGLPAADEIMENGFDTQILGL